LPQGGRLTSSYPKEQTGEAMLELLKFALEQDAGRAELIEHVNELTRLCVMATLGNALAILSLGVLFYIHKFDRNAHYKKDQRVVKNDR